MSHTDDYFSGWQDSIAELQRRLEDTEHGCLNCALDQVRFDGIARAAGATHTGATNVVIAGQVAERFLVTALGDNHAEQAQLLRHARTLVTRQPAAAVEMIVLLVLLAAKRYDRNQVVAELPPLQLLEQHEHIDEQDPEHDHDHSGRDYWR